MCSGRTMQRKEEFSEWRQNRNSSNNNTWRTRRKQTRDHNHLLITWAIALIAALSGFQALITCADACASTDFQCDNGNCIPAVWACDRKDDCGDNSDETAPECGYHVETCDTGFRCHNGLDCIPEKWRCDGEQDCADGSDENVEMCRCIGDDFACHSSLCIPQSWVCDGHKDCPDGKDEAKCMSNFNCTIDQFTCVEDTVKKCLPLTWVCDGVADCANGSDERACNATCTTTEFTCRNGKCIYNHWRCDGNNDCNDNSDEENCPPKPCTPGKDFTCKTDGFCIQAGWQCDGEPDCQDGSDEEGCPEDNRVILSKCPKSEFACADRLTCIHRSWICDTEEDCPDGSDEDEFLCRNMTCRADQFRCASSECIPVHLRCSRSKECADGSDELNCPLDNSSSSTAKPSVEQVGGNATIVPTSGCDRSKEFDCGSGKCIPLDKVCDQRNDCGNWKDEPKELCGKNECLINNGNCSQNCVNTKYGHVCECRKGYRLVDKIRCEDINECEIPGSCSQRCINEQGGFKCECLDGYLRDPKDHTRCKAVEGHASLLFAVRQDIRKISLDHLKMTLIVEETRKATALDYMFRTGMIFWADSHEGKIYKAPIDEGQAKSVVIDDQLKSSDGLAIDWIYNHIYWTDSAKKEIAVAELDGKMRKVLVKKDLVEPRSIAVNPLDGWMYWSDWGTSPGKIERAGMDGSNRHVITTDGVVWPNGLTLDLIHSKIFWVDAKMHSISSANFDGTGRRLVLQSPTVLYHPFSITTFEDYLYWTDWKNETLFKANKFNGGEVTQILPLHSVKYAMSIHVYHAYRQPDGENYCTPLNGRCSHLCLPAPRVRSTSSSDSRDPSSSLISCACPDGLVLGQDGQNCSPDESHRIHHYRQDDEYPSKGKKGAKEKNRRTNKLNHQSSHIGAESANEDGTLAGRKIPAHSLPTGNAVRGFVVGSVIAIFLLVSVIGFVMYRHVIGKAGDSMNFDNPVYRKTTTTEDSHIQIEKSRGFHKTYPATIAEEAQEPLTHNMNVSEYV